jgi:hypothetical protein
MATVVCRTSSIPIMAAAVLCCLDHARHNDETFRFGPLDDALLASDGLTVSGDIGKVLIKLQSIKGLDVQEQP